MPESLRVLLIEDNPHDARFVKAMLAEVRPTPSLVHDSYLEEALRHLEASLERKAEEFEQMSRAEGYLAHAGGGGIDLAAYPADALMSDVL